MLFISLVNSSHLTTFVARVTSSDSLLFTVLCHVDSIASVEYNLLLITLLQQRVQIRYAASDIRNFASLVAPVFGVGSFMTSFWD